MNVFELLIAYYYMQYSPYLRAIPSTLTVWATHGDL